MKYSLYTLYVSAGGLFMRGKAGRKKISNSGERVRERKALSGLQIIADHLNDLPVLRTLVAGRDCDPLEKENCENWTLAETIVSASSLTHASEMFTLHANKHPVTMVVEYPVMDIKKGPTPAEDRFIEKDTEPPHAAIASRDEAGTVLWHLWQFYFQDRGWKRLKRCPVCQKWFEDTSQNRRKERCSAVCTNKYWNRYQRSGRTKPVPPSHVDKTASPVPLSRTQLEKIIAEEAHRDEVYRQGLPASRAKALAEQKKQVARAQQKGGKQHGQQHRQKK
jgi:hypothetical protein